MNSIMQKVHSVLMFLMIIGMIAIGIFMRDELRTEQAGIKTQSEDLDQEVNSAVEKHDRFDLKLLGHGKHLATMQKETNAHYAAYKKKVEEIGEEFDRVALRIDDLEETITQKLDRLSDQITILSEEFATNKRTQNRANRQTKMDIKDLGAQIESLDRQLNPEKYKEEEGKK